MEITVSLGHLSKPALADNGGPIRSYRVDVIYFLLACSTRMTNQNMYSVREMERSLIRCRQLPERTL